MYLVHVNLQTLNMCSRKIDNVWLFSYKDERSDKRNQILQKAVANWLNSEGNTDPAFMVGEFKMFFLCVCDIFSLFFLQHQGSQMCRSNI